MALVRVDPTNLDVAIADAISGHARPGPERAAKALTWGADEHILCALAAGWWLWCRGKDADYRRASDHVLLTTLVSSALPHLLKVVFDQERPDRRTIRGHWRGIPFSGKRLDAFPSGTCHAYRRAGFCREQTSCQTTKCHLESRCRVGSDKNCSSGALGERRRRRARSWRADGAAAKKVDGLWA